MAVTSELGWPKILLIYALGVFAAMAVSQAVPVIGQIAFTFHPPSRSVVGLVISLPSLVVALGALAVGWLVDRYGARIVLISGSALLVVGDVATAFAPSFNGLLGGRIISGVGYVGVAVSAVAMITRATEGRRRTASLSLWSSFVPMSFIVPFLVAGLVAQPGQWRWAFNGHAIVVAVLALTAVFVLPEGRLISPYGARTAGLAAVLRSPWTYVLGISFGAAAFMQSGIVATLGSYWAQRYGVSEGAVQSYNAIAMAANIVGCLAVGRLIAVRVPVWMIGIAGTILSAIGGIVVFATPISLSGAIAASWLFTFGAGLLVGMWVLLPQVAPSLTCMGATSGLVTQITLLGVLLGSPAAFAAQAAATATPMLVFILGALAVGLLALPIWLGSGARNSTVQGLASH